MSQFIKFYFTSSMLVMFRTLIYPSPGACDFSIVSPHWLSVLVSMCVGVSVWLGWGGVILSSLKFINVSRIALRNPYNKSQRDAQLSQIYFDKVLYMFRANPLSIIRSISTLYT